MSRLRKRCSSEGIQGREGKVIPGTVVGVTTARHFLRRGSIDRFAVGTLTTNCVEAVSLGLRGFHTCLSACVQAVVAEPCLSACA